MDGRGIDMSAISVVGLGRLGLCTAACFASAGFDVVGVDLDATVVAAVNNGIAPFHESGLQALLDQVGPRLRATQAYADAIHETDVTFLVVPTPSEPEGHFSDRHLRDALSALAGPLRGGRKDRHTFVITSTVSPGTTEARLIPLIESESGQRLGRDFDVCYNPEFIALGSVISDFLHPDLVLIGESGPEAGARLEEIYGTVCKNRPRVARMSLVSAEIAKLSLNAYVTMKISFANTLAAVCEAVPDADIDAIGQALGADKRVSPHALRGGLPFGGPCFPRDNRAFAAFAKDRGVEAPLAEATDAVNGQRLEHLLRLMMRALDDTEGPRRAVSILGLAYKAETPVIEESAGLRIVEALLRHNAVEITVYDPLAMEHARRVFGDRIRYASSARECVRQSPVCVITTAADEFSHIDATYIHHQPTVIIDCWRRLDVARLGGRAVYVALGAPYRIPERGART
jgi:UDPglucose 6-dehydrogenase